MKYYAYCRVSSEREDKQVLSPESQKRELREYAQKHNLKIVKTFSERGSAYKTGRPEFNKMLEGLERGEADGLIVFHLSRIARNSSDGGRVIYMMDEGTIKEIRTKDKVYTNCSDDKFLMQIHFAMNKKSSDDNSTFVKRDILTKVGKGEFPGKAPLGYLNISKDGVIASKQYNQRKQELLLALERPLKRVEQDPLIAPLLRKIFDYALTGEYGLNSLIEEAYKLGVTSAAGTRLSKSAMKNLISKRFYCGSFVYQDVIWQGQHEPLISEHEHEFLLEIQSKKSRPKTTKREYLFSMMICCEKCGNPLSSDHQKGKDYLRCTKAKGLGATCSNNKYYNQEEVGKQVLEKLKLIQVPHSIVEWGIKQLTEVYKKESEINIVSQEKVNQHIGQLKRQISNLSAKWLSSDNLNGDLISDKEYKGMKGELQRQIEEQEEALNSTKHEGDNWLQKCEDFFNIARAVVSKYEDLNSIQDKRVLLSMIGSKFILTGENLTIELEKPYFDAYEANRKARAIRTARKTTTKSTNEVCATELDVWQAR